MRVEDIREILQTRPFKPFVLHMADGKTLSIDHPELMLLSRSVLVVASPVERPEAVPERVHICAPEQIVRLELMPRRASARRS